MSPAARIHGGRPVTIVSFHAHPDDEALFTGGTLARASADGHRVVIVVATDGAAGLADDDLLEGLGAHRDDELAASARALGCARVVRLGYADSGWGASARPAGFSEVDVDVAAHRLADVLREESADVLTVYDAAGGYGHPDHVQVHRVGIRAAAIAGTPVVLEATVDRRLIRWGVRIASWIPGFDIRPADFRDAYSATGEITHRVDVRPYADAKRAALRAHASQAGGGDVRTLAILTRLPGPLFRVALGREWFIERGRPAGERTDDILDTVSARVRHARPGTKGSGDGGGRDAPDASGASETGGRLAKRGRSFGVSAVRRRVRRVARRALRRASRRRKPSVSGSTGRPPAAHASTRESPTPHRVVTRRTSDPGSVRR